MLGLDAAGRTWTRRAELNGTTFFMDQHTGESRYDLPPGLVVADKSQAANNATVGTPLPAAQRQYVAAPAANSPTAAASGGRRKAARARAWLEEQCGLTETGVARVERLFAERGHEFSTKGFRGFGIPEVKAVAAGNDGGPGADSAQVAAGDGAGGSAASAPSALPGRPTVDIAPEGAVLDLAAVIAAASTPGRPAESAAAAAAGAAALASPIVSPGGAASAFTPVAHARRGRRGRPSRRCTFHRDTNAALLRSY